MRYLQDRDEAEDVMQDCFVKIFTQIKTYRQEGSFEGWAKRIAVNTALSALKKKKSIQFERNLVVVETIEFDSEEQTDLGLDDIMDSVCQLPPGYRTILNL